MAQATWVAICSLRTVQACTSSRQVVLETGAELLAKDCGTEALVGAVIISGQCSRVPVCTSMVYMDKTSFNDATFTNITVAALLRQQVFISLCLHASLC